MSVIQFLTLLVYVAVGVSVGLPLLYFAVKLVTFAYYRAKEQAKLLNDSLKSKHEENKR